MEALMDNICADKLPGINNIVSLDEVTSTQEIARELACEGCMEKTLVISGTQRSGKGRMGRVWESAEGGIYMTLILKPETGIRFLGDLSVLAGTAVSQTLKEMYFLKTRIKLPNDVYAWNPYRKKYLKISGILTEAASINKRPNWVLLGIGVNINNSPALDTATSVAKIIRREVSRHEFLETFYRNFWALYASWEYASQSKSS